MLWTVIGPVFWKVDRRLLALYPAQDLCEGQMTRRVHYESQKFRIKSSRKEEKGIFKKEWEHNKAYPFLHLDQTTTDIMCFIIEQLSQARHNVLFVCLTTFKWPLTTAHQNCCYYYGQCHLKSKWSSKTLSHLPRSHCLLCSRSAESTDQDSLKHWKYFKSTGEWDNPN